MKLLLSILTVGILNLACERKIAKDPAPAPTEITSDTTIVVSSHNARNSLDYIGAYKGKLSCQNCPEGEIMLELSEEFNYIMTRQTNGKKQELKGTFSWNKSGTSVILDNLKTNYNTFFVGENTLTLTRNGERLANNVLTKLSDSDAAKTDAPANPMATLPGTKWTLKTLYQTAVSPQSGGKPYFVNFNNDRTFEASGGCNNIGGKYRISTSTIIFSEVRATRMACADMKTEQQLLQAFADSDNFKVNGQTLELRQKGKIVATFEKK